MWVDRDDNGIILGYSWIYDTSSGNLLHRYGKWTIEISNLPLQIVISIATLIYQRVVVVNSVFSDRGVFFPLLVPVFFCDRGVLFATAPSLFSSTVSGLLCNSSL